MAERGKRKMWTKAETLLFLKCYSARKEDFLHARRKKYAFAHVLEDMVHSGFEDTTVTEVSLHGRMRTLLSAYKSAKDNAMQTGASATTIPYFEEMEEIFGTNAMMSNDHSLSVGSIVEILPSSVSCNSTEYVRQSTVLSEISDPNATIYVSTSALSTAPVNATPERHQRQRVRKSAKERYWEKKLELKKGIEREKLEMTAKFQDDVSSKLKELVECKNKQLAMDAEKLKLLNAVVANIK